MSKQTVSLDILAKVLCVSERRVQQLAKDNIVIRATDKASRGEYELISSVQGYIRFLQNEVKEGLSGSTEFKDSKTRQAKAKAEHEELKVQKLRGELVYLNDISKVWSDLMAVFKSRMRNIPNRVAPIVRQAKSDGEAQKTLKTSIDEALQELSQASIHVIAHDTGDT